MRTPTTLAAGLCLLSLCAVAGCSDDGGGDGAGSSGGSGQVGVVASTNVWGAIAADVGGDHVDVTSFISSPGQDPHSYEASTRNVLTVSDADLVIHNGGGYDDFMDQLLDSASTTPDVLTAVDVSGLDAGGDFNEHVWYDLPTAQKMAAAIADSLAEIDPDNAAEYRRNAKAFSADVQDVVVEQQGLRGSLEGTAVGVTEPVPGYLLDALGLRDVTPEAFSEAIEEGLDVPVSVLGETLDLYADGTAKLLVYNEQTSGPITEQVQQAATDAGVPVVGVTETLPEGETYVDWMRANTEAVADALVAPQP